MLNVRTMYDDQHHKWVILIRVCIQMYVEAWMVMEKFAMNCQAKPIIHIVIVVHSAIATYIWSIWAKMMSKGVGSRFDSSVHTRLLLWSQSIGGRYVHIHFHWLIVSLCHPQRPWKYLKHQMDIGYTSKRQHCRWSCSQCEIWMKSVYGGVLA